LGEASGNLEPCDRAGRPEVVSSSGLGLAAGALTHPKVPIFKALQGDEISGNQPAERHVPGVNSHKIIPMASA
jgi:hypothetical protein